MTLQKLRSWGQQHETGKYWKKKNQIQNQTKVQRQLAQVGWEWGSLFKKGKGLRHVASEMEQGCVHQVVGHQKQGGCLNRTF